MATRRAPPPKTVEEYLQRVPPPSRTLLRRLRRTILDAAPGSQEGISYGMPVIRSGRVRLNFAAFSDHCSLFGWARVRSQFSTELRPFEQGRGTLHFSAEHPLPPQLVARLVKALLAEDRARPPRRP